MDTKRLREIVEENISLIERKNRDYSGSSGDNIIETGMVGMATRIIDKASRFRNLVDKPNGEINFESVSDTLNDLMNYSIIARMLEEGCWQTKPKLVYLAGPIDGVSQDEAIGWREATAAAINKKGINVFNPAKAYNICDLSTVKKQIADIDRAAIRECDVVIANLYGNGKGFGTIREIEYAVSLGKRVIVVIDKLESAFAHDVEAVELLKDAVELL